MADEIRFTIVALVMLIILLFTFIAGFLICYIPARYKRNKLERNDVDLSIKNATLASTKNEEHFTQLATSALNNIADEFLKKLDERMNEKEQVIDKTVTPIADKINTLDEHIKKLEGAREQAYTSLNKNCEDLKAVFGTPKKSGAWGELSLENIMKYAGMSEHVDYCKQSSLDNKKKPDVIIHLPGNRCLIVDAKSPLNTYREVMNTQSKPDSIEHKEARKNFNNAITTNIHRLSGKEYWQSVEKSQKKEYTPEFVVMYFPLEEMLLLALDSDKDIFKIAAEKNVIMTNPSSLLALAKTIAYVWQQDELNNNTKKIGEISRSLLDELTKFYNNYFYAIGDNLAKSVNNYNKATQFLTEKVPQHQRNLKPLDIGGSDLKDIKPVKTYPNLIEQKKT
ncbi:MAG: DNA recombination protein RmuC [Proteobacteria bacterium]|nr:DNA recombination protein RmuC [Pseudomonadota bacterium]